MSARKRLPSHPPKALTTRAGPGNDPLQHLPAGEGERGCDCDGKGGASARSESGGEGEPLQGYEPWRSDDGDRAANGFVSGHKLLFADKSPGLGDLATGGRFEPALPIGRGLGSDAATQGEAKPNLK